MKVGRLLVPAAATGAAAVAGASAWVVAERMLMPPHEAEAREEPGEDARATVVEAGAESVLLAGAGASRPGTWGISWPGGYGQVGEPVEDVSGQVHRGYRPLLGVPPPGTPVVLDVDAYPDDPSTLGLEFEDVAYHSPAGRLPAWAIPAPAPGTAWAVLVHGRSGTRRQGLKLVPVLHRLGISSLLISFRGDSDAAGAGDGLNRLGAAEWQDVESAVVWCLSRGASDVVLVGASMGGTAVLTFLRSSPHAARVRAAVLDAPVLDWPAVLRRAARRHGAPRVLAATSVAVAQAIGTARARIDWDAISHADNASAFRHPLLIVHGAEDEQVPLSDSEGFARRRPDITTLLAVPGAGHLAAWNLDPARVEAAIAEFLSSARPPSGWDVAGRARAAVARGMSRVSPGRRSRPTARRPRSSPPRT